VFSSLFMFTAFQVVLITISEFIGHFHPVLVHLPIGFLLLACLFLWLDKKENSYLQPAIGIALLVGMISAVIACITGFLLSRSDDYDEQLADRHQWFGISVAVSSIVMYYLYKKSVSFRLQKGVAILLFLLIMITGHLGGSLTHGSDYLTKGLHQSTDSSNIVQKAIPNVQEAIAYTDIIQPILQNKCYGCHGPNKQKGKLRMDQTDRLMKGGKDGPVIIAGNTEKSEMSKRLELPREHEDHMPPKEKSQLNDEQIALIHWWIESGASLDKKVKDLPQPEKIKPALLALQKTAEKKLPPDIPPTPVEKADEAVLKKLKDTGVVVIPVAQNSNYLVADFITARKLTGKEIELLLPLKKQLVWLKLGNTLTGDSATATIGQFTNLMRLQLEHTNITDKGLHDLSKLKNLRYLNLVGTKVTAAGLMELKDLKNLRSLYLFQTNVIKSDWATLKKFFPKTEIDSGGYSLPFLETDTMTVKPPKINN